VECLVLDEGDTALDWLGNYLAVEVWEQRLVRAGLGKVPEEGAGLVEVQQWARRMVKPVKDRGSEERGVKERLEWYRLSGELDRLSGLVGSWVTSWEGRAGTAWRVMKVEAVEPGEYREELLQGVEDVVVMSATLTLRYMEVLAG
jgi:hypothetical protein